MAAAALVGTAVIAACGDESRQTHSATIEDLHQMVLQREDVPADFVLREGEREGLGLQTDGEAGSEAVYSREFERPPEETEPGETACVVTGAALYQNDKAAEDAMRDVEDQFLMRATEGGEVEEVQAPDLGDDAVAIRLFGPGAVFCSGYENQPSEAYYMMFRNGSVLGVLALYARERPASFDEAVTDAQKQAERIEAVLGAD
jgi:hypothetical protein